MIIINGSDNDKYYITATRTGKIFDPRPPEIDQSQMRTVSGEFRKVQLVLSVLKIVLLK